MESYELLREVSAPLGIKRVAAELKVSPQLFHKWTQPVGVAHDGRMNPLERVAQLLEVTQDRRLADWICAQADGSFVANAPVNNLAADLPAARLTVLQDLNQIQAALLETLKQPGCPKRAQGLRRRWEVLKSNLERLVCVMERGEFRRNLLVWFLKLYPVWDALTPGGLI